MSHHIYTTDGFVLSGINVGEANRFLKIFTKDFGMISGSAQGVRHSKSKLRYSLQDLSYTSVSLVKGRDAWRIVSAKQKENIATLLRSDPRKFEIFARTLSLLRRFVHGEEKNDSLFDIVTTGFLTIAGDDSLSPQELKNFERILVLRILHHLGYVKKLDELKPFAETVLWSKEILADMEIHKALALQEINRSLSESQL